MKTTIIFAIALLFLFTVGCTVHFKATDVELDTVANTTYELDKMSLFVSDDRAGKN